MSAEEITLLRGHLERAVARYEKAEARLADVEAEALAAIKQTGEKCTAMATAAIKEMGAALNEAKADLEKALASAMFDRESRLRAEAELARVKAELADAKAVIAAVAPADAKTERPTLEEVYRARLIQAEAEVLMSSPTAPASDIARRTVDEALSTIVDLNRHVEKLESDLEMAVTAAAACDMDPGDLAFDGDGYPVTVVVGAIIVVERANGARYGVPAHTLKPRES